MCIRDSVNFGEADAAAAVARAAAAAVAMQGEVAPTPVEFARKLNSKGAENAV